MGGDNRECGVCGTKFDGDGALCDGCPFRRPVTSPVSIKSLRCLSGTYGGQGNECKDVRDSMTGLGATEIERRYVLREKVRNAVTIEKLKKMALDRSPIDPATAVEKSAANIATAMTRIHGGCWLIQIEHQSGFVLVMRHSPG